MTDQIEWKVRELEILQLLAMGLTDREIGERLHLAHETVRWYNKKVFEKLGVNSRTQAVNRATNLGLLADSEGAASAKADHRPVRSPVRYVANGDVHIAYQVIGNGPIDLLFIHGFLSHLELAWENPEFTGFFEQLGRTVRVILFDKRGMGLSDRIQGAPTLENTIEDACCVLDAVRSERAVIMGTSEGGAAAVLLAATYPQRVRGLILYAAIPNLIKTGNEPVWAYGEDQFEQMIEQMQRNWGGSWAIQSFAPSRVHDAQFREWWATILRAASSPSSVKAILNLVREIDIRPLLPQVRVKTLVIHKTDDRNVVIEAGRYIADQMPNATLVELLGADHIYFIESEAIISAVTQFCLEETASDVVDTSIAIVLCVLPNGTRIAANELQSQIVSYRPRQASTTAQGTIALFDSPTRALHCALQLRDTAKQNKLKISLHVGECYVASGRPTDSVLKIANLAAQQVSPGEVAVTRTLRDILAGTGFVFEERQVAAARNLAENIPLYRLV